MNEPDLNPCAAWFRQELPKPVAVVPTPRTLEHVYDDATEAELDAFQREQRMIAPEQTLQTSLMHTKSRLREIALSMQRYQRLLDELRDCQESSDRAEALLLDVRRDVRSRMNPPASLPADAQQDPSIDPEADDIQDLADARAAVLERRTELTLEQQRLNANLEGLRQQARDTRSRRDIASQDFDRDISLLVQDINGSLETVPDGQKHRFRTFIELLEDHSQVTVNLLEEIRRAAAEILGIIPTPIGGA